MHLKRFDCIIDSVRGTGIWIKIGKGGFATVYNAAWRHLVMFAKHTKKTFEWYMKSAKGDGIE